MLGWVDRNGRPCADGYVVDAVVVVDRRREEKVNKDSAEAGQEG